MKKIKNGLHNNTSLKQSEAREHLKDIFKNRPMSDEQLLTNSGLFCRASALAKVFFLREGYEKVVNIPGDIFIYGVWLGQDMVLMESLRAILEPYNSSRKVVGFDTFSGYANIKTKDKTSDVISGDGYKSPNDYEAYLSDLLAYHRSENTMGHAINHELIKGDASKTSKKYIKDNPACIVALAYFDLALYNPTLAALQSISSRLIKGSVVIFDELNDSRYPGETLAFWNWIKDFDYEITRSKFLPDRTFVTIK